MPFDTPEFLDVFRRYHGALPTAPWLLAVLGVALVACAMMSVRRSSRWILLGLGGLWLWMGVVYHLAFFRRINPAAWLFGVAFLVQGAAFLRTAATHSFTTRPQADRRGIMGAVLIVYALLVYPLLSLAFGHRYPAMPTFGLPCPTTIFTFGLLLWLRPPVPRSLLVIPAAWSLIGTIAATRLGMREDFGLLGAALIAVPLLLRTPRFASDGALGRGSGGPPSGRNPSVRAHSAHALVRGSPPTSRYHEKIALRMLHDEEEPKNPRRPR
jgi:hypothetical protein